MTQTLSSKKQNLPEGWFGFADLGNDNFATYNDITQMSCVNALMATIYSELQYKTKLKIQENGYLVKDLSSMSKFEIEYEQMNAKIARRIARFPKREEERKKLKSPISPNGSLKSGNDKFLNDLVSLCNDELSEIMSKPNKKQKMFESLKKYYALMENYYKFNSPHNKHSIEYSFDDYKKLPTTISMSLYQKYQQELLNGERQQGENDKKEKSFLQEFQEFFRADKTLESGIEAT